MALRLGSVALAVRTWRLSPQLVVSLLFAFFPELGTPCLIYHQSLKRSHTATSYTVHGPEQSLTEYPRKKDYVEFIDGV